MALWQYLAKSAATVWGRVGRTPVLRIAGRGWTKISIAGALAVPPDGKHARGRRIRQFFRLYEHDIDGPTCATFLRELLRAVRGPPMLLWDGLAVHRSPAARAVLAGRRRVEVIRLQSYAPELNPVEPMWGHAKGVGLRGFVQADALDLELETDFVLNNISREKRLLRGFFRATTLRVPGVTT